jgi:hypothetical protein
MTGLTNLTGFNELNYITGQLAQPTFATFTGVWLALFTGIGTDAGTGFTEVSTSGTAYARVQLAGQLAASSAATTIITFGAVPSWVVAGMSVNDVTTPANVPANTVVSSVTGTTVTCNNTVSGVGTDTIRFSAFLPASGTAPATTSNGSIVAFAAATGAGFGTVLAWGLYDAVTAGNLLQWDFLGNFNWLPFEMPTATGVATVKAHGYASNDPVVFTAEYGGTLPTFSTGVMTAYQISFAGTITTDSFIPNTTSGPTTPFVSTASGSGMVRKIVQQSIPAGVTASFAAATLTLTLA